MCTSIGGPIGAAMIAGGGAAAKMTTGVTSCLGRNILTGALEGSLTGGAGGALAKVTDVARYGCFTKDTPVLMADGTAKPIQDVVAGDEVMAFNADTGANEPATVTRTFTHEDVETLVVRTNQGDITTTATHPFYVKNRGYTPAGQLHEGDHLHTPDGNTVQVLNIQSTGQHHTVHNLEVNGLHNYHVATDNQTWVLVHNNDGCGDDMMSVYRTPPRGRGQAEAEHGLDPTNFQSGDRSAYIGDERVAQEYSNYNVGSHEDGYTRFEVPRSNFEETFGKGHPYQGGDLGREWAIPADKIQQFNDMTQSREWIWDY